MLYFNEQYFTKLKSTIICIHKSITCLYFLCEDNEVNFCLFVSSIVKAELTTNKLVKLMSYNFMGIVSKFDNQGISMSSNLKLQLHC